MFLYLLRASELRVTKLPEKVSGQYPVFYTSDNGREETLVRISAQADGWTVQSNENVTFHGAEKLLLRPESIFTMRRKTGETMLLYAQQASVGHGSYRFYQMLDGERIHVGSSENNEIIYDCFALGSRSITIWYQNGSYRVDNRDYLPEHQYHKSYLDRVMVSRQMETKPGSVIFLFGMKILLGRGFIAINSPGGRVRVRMPKYCPPTFHLLGEEERLRLSEGEEGLFSSAPRIYRSELHREFQIETPPSPNYAPETPWLVMVGPALTMSVGSVLSNMVTIQNLLLSGGSVSSAIPSMIMSLVMVTGSAVWPTIGRKIQKRQRQEKETLAAEDYRNYLKWVTSEIQKTATRQKAILNHNHPSLRSCIEIIYKVKPSLWERSYRHEDFLQMMVGHGSLPLDAEFKYQERSYSSQISNEAKEMYKLVEQKYTVHDVPITVPFAQSGVIGVIGSRQKVLSFTKALVIELTALHNYEDLKLAFIYDPAEETEWRYTKWIPHVWNEQQTIRSIACNLDELKNLSDYLQTQRAGERRETKNHTHYIVFAGKKNLVERSRVITELYQEKSSSNITIVALYNQQQYLPKECRYVVDLGHGKSKTMVYDYNDTAGIPLVCDTNISCQDDPEALFIHMSNIKLSLVEQQGKFPIHYTMMEMLGAGRAEHIDLLSNWKNSDSVSSLNAQIGIDSNGYPIGLDIHEKAHGPHGLIAGMTGSGKSEFIISYIASMAVRFSPEDVAFVLIDFKGGGMADVFKNLPHTAGLITNLDGNELKRSFMAIESELQKRQKLFKKISEQKKISNIDIYKYQNLRKEDPSLKALPHLILISDEFAELKQQHRDFMEQLIRIARIGRSLGVHLILATQKPDGVVDDQIKSNIRFKVCLKVQDESDSKNMISRPDAAHITSLGRYYFQVGNDEIFELGQSPWSGARYEPCDTVKQNICDEIEVINRQGQTLLCEAPQPAPREAEAPEKQIDALVVYISEVARQNGCCAEKLWLKPIAGPEIQEEQMKPQDTTVHPFVLNPVVGVYDDLKNQKHLPLVIPFTEGGNTLLYGAAGTGVLEFIISMLIQLLRHHGPEELKLYLLDYEAGTLSAFQNAPQTCLYAGGSSGADGERAIACLLDELRLRKETLTEYGGDYHNYLRLSGKALPNLLLVVYNYQNFADIYTEARGDISLLAREGTQYGIYVFLSGTTGNSIPYMMQPLFHNVYTLRQNSESQYHEILGKTEGITPENYRGRGLARINGIVCEFQTDIVFQGAESVYSEIQRFSAQLCEQYPETLSSRIAEQKYDWAEFETRKLTTELDRLPVGISPASEDVQYLSLFDQVSTLVLYDKSRQEQYYGLQKLLLQCSGKIRYFGTNQKVVRRAGASAVKPPQFSSEIENLWNEMLRRGAEGSKCRETGNPLPNFPHLTYVFDGVTTIIEWLDELPHQHFAAMLQGLSLGYHIHFLFLEESGQTGTLMTSAYLQGGMPFGQGILLSENPAARLFFELEAETGHNVEQMDYLIRQGQCEVTSILTLPEEERV